jgi:hypothetical protein
MTASFKNNIKFAVAIILIAISGFWFNMEGYQKDRVATVIVRSVEGVVTQSGERQRLESEEANESLETAD